MEQIILQGLNVKDFKQLLQDVVEEKFKVIVQSGQVQSNQVSSKNTTYLTRKETAKVLKISLPTLNEWTKQGKIKAYRIGSRILYKPDEIENSLNQMYCVKFKRG